MAYIAQSDLAARLTQQELIELTDDAGTGEVNQQVLTSIIEQASSLIDTYTGGRYQLPLAVSEQVRGLALDIATYLLFLRRRRIAAEVQLAYDNAIALLRDVAAGRASLAQPAQPQQSEMDVKVRDHIGDPELFDDTKTEGF
jgi:phage gp36-like protein